MDYILIFIFISVILYALKKEKRRWGAPSSPLFLVVVFNLAVLFLYHITSNLLGFHPLVIRTLTVLLYGCFIFACVSLVASSSTHNIQSLNNPSELRYVSPYPSKKVLIIALATIAFMYLKMLAIGIANIIEDEDAAAAFGGNGISGHILVLQILLLAHIIGRHTTKLSIIAIIGLTVSLFLYNVKAWIIIPFIIGYFIRRDLWGAKLNPLYFIIGPLIIFAIFSVSYMIVLGWDMDNMTFIWAHFCKYVYAGIGGLNEALAHNYPTGTAIWYGLPSFIRLFFPVEIKAPSVYDYVVINDINGEYTNVFSLFGGAYLFNGLFMGTIYIAIIAVISYKLYQNRLKTTNYWYYLSYYLWSSGLILSFFGNYYTLLNIWEFTTVSFIIGWWCKHSKRTIKNDSNTYIKLERMERYC